MTLTETLNYIRSRDDFDDLMTVYVKTPWNRNSDAIIVPQPDDGNTAPIEGHNYFLEVFIIKDFLEDLESSQVSVEACDRIIEYAINDA